MQSTSHWTAYDKYVAGCVEKASFVDLDDRVKHTMLGACDLRSVMALALVMWTNAVSDKHATYSLHIIMCSTTDMYYYMPALIIFALL